MIGLLLAIMVLVVAGVVVLAVALGGDSGDDDDDGTPPLGTSAPGAGSSGEAGASDSPERVVEDYLEAAVAGDCAGAQELLVTSDPTHCEERIASMDDPDVTLAGTEEQEAGVEVKVVYVIGDKEDSDYFTVEQQDGDWVIASVLSHEEKEAQEEEGEESPDAGPSPEELAEELAKDAVQRWISVIDSGSCDRATEAATEEYAAQCERGVSTWHESYELDDWRDSQTEVISSDVVEVGVYLSGRPGSDGSRGDIMRGYYVVVLEDGVWKVADSEIQID